MLNGLDPLLAATALFVAGHFLLSSQPLRQPLIRSLGEGGFRGAYSVLVLAAFVWMLLQYGAAPYVEVWVPVAWTRWIPVLLMPFAAILVVGGVTQPSPTLVGGERVSSEAPTRSPAKGFLSITRHPFLNGTALWALTHLAANGDGASIILMGGILVLSVGGMLHIDLRRIESLGAEWGPIALTTSRLPFLAALQGRTQIDWAGLGWWRILGGLLLYAALLGGHGHLIGVPALPGLPGAIPSGG